MPVVPDAVPVQNTTAEVIPPFGLMRVTGVTDDGFTKVAKPDTDGQYCLVNGPTAIAPMSNGQGTNNPRVFLAVDTSEGSTATDGPKVGDTWGAASGQWTAKKNNGGFQIVGGAAFGVVNAVRQATVPISSWKSVVRCASVANINIANPGTSTFDGVTLSVLDPIPRRRILVKNNTAGAENGIYQFNGSAEPLTRTADASADDSLVGAVVWVSEGTVNKDTIWACTTDAPIEISVTTTEWVLVYPSSFYARLTTQDTGGGTPSFRWKWVRQAYNGSTWVDVGDESETYSAVQSQSTAMKAETGLVVLMFPVGLFYAFFPINYADRSYPGLVSTDTQEIRGDKLFINSVIVNSDAENGEKLQLLGEGLDYIRPDSTFIASSATTCNAGDPPCPAPGPTATPFAAVGGYVIAPAGTSVSNVGGIGILNDVPVAYPDYYPRCDEGNATGIPLSVSGPVAATQLRMYLTNLDANNYPTINWAYYSPIGATVSCCESVLQLGSTPCGLDPIPSNGPVLVGSNWIGVPFSNRTGLRGSGIRIYDPSYAIPRYYTGLSGGLAFPYVINYKDHSGTNQTLKVISGIIVDDSAAPYDPLQVPCPDPTTCTGTSAISYDCTDGDCVQVEGSGGAYATLAECQEACEEVTVTAVDTGTTLVEGSTTATLSFEDVTIPSGSFLIITAGSYSPSSSPVISATFAGGGISVFGSVSLPAGSLKGRMSLLCLFVATGSTGTLSVTASSGSGGYTGLIASVVYAGGLTGAFDQYVSASGTSSAPNSGAPQ